MQWNSRVFQYDDYRQSTSGQCCRTRDVVTWSPVSSCTFRYNRSCLQCHQILTALHVGLTASRHCGFVTLKLCARIEAIKKLQRTSLDKHGFVSVNDSGVASVWSAVRQLTAAWMQENRESRDTSYKQMKVTSVDANRNAGPNRERSASWAASIMTTGRLLFSSSETQSAGNTQSVEYQTFSEGANKAMRSSVFLMHYSTTLRCFFRE